MSGAATKGWSGFCLDSLREAEADVYPALLFLPEDIRHDVAALNAFHHETGRIAYVVKEPLPGEIRLQWWRDVLCPAEGEGREAGEANANPLARELLDVIARRDLPRDGFERYLDARQFDLYNDAMPDRTSLEGYFGETESFILKLCANVAGIETDTNLADACGHGGVAIGLARRLKLLAHDRTLQKTYLPEDLLQSAGLTRESWLSVATTENHEIAVAAAIALANEHVKEAVDAIRRYPRSAQAVFLPVVIARNDIAAMKSAGALLKGSFSPSPLRRQFSLWKAAFSGF